VVLSPQGRRFDQAQAERLARAPDGFVLVCGRYEGIDERAIEVLQPEELSLGDFVLSGGEAAALAILDAAARLVPGVLGDERSPVEESFGESGMLDHPHYTRPVVVRGLEVPAVLRGGNHAEIARWRRERALERTQGRRPDLLSARRPASDEARS
jgi:tRNA (guanine37-N1)-methyltransferase